MAIRFLDLILTLTSGSDMPERVLVVWCWVVLLGRAGC